ncbi:MAG: outer membrane protein assembly factor BamE, partial [Pseudorhodobacter sp.]|nr:outer membrane protein assembly factor BamE [Rhizobacter sp.]
MLMKITLALLTVVLSLSALVGCDMKKIEALEEGVATEAEVRAQWGEPA